MTKHKLQKLEEFPSSPGALTVLWRTLCVVSVMLLIMAIGLALIFVSVGFFLELVFGLDGGICAIGGAVAALISIKLWLLWGGHIRLAKRLHRKFGAKETAAYEEEH